MLRVPWVPFWNGKIKLCEEREHSSASHCMSNSVQASTSTMHYYLEYCSQHLKNETSGRSSTFMHVCIYISNLSVQILCTWSLDLQVADFWTCPIIHLQGLTRLSQRRIISKVQCQSKISGAWIRVLLPHGSEPNAINSWRPDVGQDLTRH